VRDLSRRIAQVEQALQAATRPNAAPTTPNGGAGDGR
jgi:hypothetical protein